MKALSLKQPYAELVVSGKKIIELRKWNTKFRGKFLVHASKNIDKNAMKRFGFTELPVGCIIGSAVLKDVKIYRNSEEFDRDKNFHLASEEYGNFGFVLEKPERLKKILCRGNLNFWEFDK